MAQFNQIDLVVIGAGPAGLMAAGQAAAAGVRVLLLEKKQRPALKLRITGKGRCNLTNTAERSEFIQHFGREGRFLHYAFGHFFSAELLDFLKSLGIETCTERGGRIFPVSNDANQVADALYSWAKGAGVQFQMNSRVLDIIPKEGLFLVQYDIGHKLNQVLTLAVVVATGGASYPGTGSTGDGYRLGKNLGHNIVPVRPALVPLETEGLLAQRLQGLSLRNAGVTVWMDGKKTAEDFGEMLFTHFGVSGPVILTLSKQIVSALNDGKHVAIQIDLKPALDIEKLDARLLREINSHPKQTFKTMLKSLLPRKMIDVCIEALEMDPVKPLSSMTKEERKQLRNWLKSLTLTVNNHRPVAEAIVSAGGIDLKEIESRSMESKISPCVFFAGEVLNLDGDTGGYNLQAAFSTGWLAGRSAAMVCQSL